MKSLAALFLALLALIGIHRPPSSTPSQASAVVLASTEQRPPALTVPTATQTQPSASTSTGATLPVQRQRDASSPTFVTQDQLTAQLGELADSLRAFVSSSTASNAAGAATPESVAANGNGAYPYAGSNRIDNLSNVTISNSTITGGNVVANSFSGIMGVGNGGTGWASIAPGYIPYGNGASVLATSTNLFWDNTNSRLGIGTTSPFTTLSVVGSGYLSGALAVGDVPTTRSNLGLGYTSSSDLAYGTHAVAWGDSLTVGNQDGTGTTYPAQLSADLGGRTVTNNGVGGQSSGQIAVRQGGINPTVTITGGQIPASGGVTVTFPIGYEPVTSQGPPGGVSGTLGGVSGTVTYNSGTLTFTRTTAGSAINTTTATFVADTGTLNTGTVIIWAGRNDISSESLVESDVGAMVAHLGSNTHYVILSILNASDEPTGTANYNHILAINAYFAANYASHYLDVREYLIQHGLADAGITPTSQDLTDISNDVIPTSLHYDSIHLTAAGYTVLAAKIANFVTGSIDTLSATSVLTQSNLSAIFGSPFPIGSTNPTVGHFTTGSFNTSLAIGKSSALQALDVNGKIAINGTQTIYDASALGTYTGTLYLGTGGSSLSHVSGTDGYYNTALGVSALNSNTTGNTNAAIGYAALYGNTTGINNVAFGASAGRFIADGATLNQTSSNSTYLGYLTKSLASGDSNEVVIGFNTTGAGSNSVTLGNTSVTKTILRGYAGIGTTSPYALLSVSNSASTVANTPLFVIASTTSGSATTTVFSVASTGNVTITGSAATCTLGNGSSATNCSSSDQRLKDDITTLEASTSLAAIRQLNPVSFKWNAWMVGNGSPTTTQFGFIAQQVAPIFGNLVTQDQNTHYFKLDYQGLFAPIVGAIQALSSEIDDLTSTVAGFALNFVSAHVTANVGDFDRLNTKELCADKSDGTQVCVTGDQLAAVFAQAGGANAAGQGDAADALSSPASTTAPIIEVNGANPAVVSIGDNYADMGATISGPSADLNLGIKTFLNGALVSDIVLDTSSVATDTIDYVATDQNGLTSTSTRTVIIQSVPPASTAEAVVATSSPAVLPDQAASSTPTQ